MSGKVQRTSEQCETHKEPIPYLTSAKHCSHPPNTECCAGYASSPFCALDASFFTVCARLLPCRAAATDRASRKCDGHLWRRRCSPFGIRPGRTRRAWSAAAPAQRGHPHSHDTPRLHAPSNTLLCHELASAADTIPQHAVALAAHLEKSLRHHRMQACHMREKCKD